MDGGFLLSINSDQTTFFFTAGGSINVIGLSGRATGLLIINYGGDERRPASPGEFSLAVGEGIPPSSSPTVSGAERHLRDLLFQGSVQVTFNATGAQQSFDIPQEFLAVLPSGFPSPIVIAASAPQINGSAGTSGAGFYFQAVVTGTSRSRTSSSSPARSRSPRRWA